MKFTRLEYDITPDVAMLCKEATTLFISVFWGIFKTRHERLRQRVLFQKRETCFCNTLHKEVRTLQFAVVL